MDIFEEKSIVKICAPMVRYSRLPFRLLVKEYDCDLCFSPMLLADSFVKSEKCRQAEFSTCRDDKPLIVQFAAKDPTDFAEASEIVYKDSNGVDLNCGCPQTWACQEGIGCCLLKHPEIVADILRQTRNRISDPNFTVSVKIRVFEDIVKTVDLCRHLEAAGISFLTVHGRTMKERCEPVRLDTIRCIVDSIDIPVIANGDIDSLEKAYAVQEITGAKGVMSARGLLKNPGLFAGYESTPISCVKRWLEISENMDSHFTMFHRHLVTMCETLLTRAERRVFNIMTSKEAVVLYLTEKFNFSLSTNAKVPDRKLLQTNETDDNPSETLESNTSEIH